MTALAIALVLCTAMTLYVVSRVTHALLQLGERMLTAQEERARSVPEQHDPIPHDLRMIAMQWGDEWAREDQLRRMRDLYREFGTWEKVRQVVMGAEGED
jgi:hypothetical protein